MCIQSTDTVHLWLGFVLLSCVYNKKSSSRISFLSDRFDSLKFKRLRIQEITVLIKKKKKQTIHPKYEKPLFLKKKRIIFLYLYQGYY